MKPDIVAKLSAELLLDLTSERQIVYILVETRKLVELGGVKANFPTLTFCCDWAVHPKLQGRFSQQVIKYFDDYQDIFENKGVMPQDYDFANLFKITKHVDFRHQLIDVLESNDIDCRRLWDDQYWARFVELYSAVIQDCPLEVKATGRSIRHVAKVLVSALPADSHYRKIVGGVVLQWVWEDAAGKILNKIDSFF